MTSADLSLTIVICTIVVAIAAVRIARTVTGNFKRNGDRDA